MTGGSLRRAGWLAMISAAITLPFFWWSLVNQGDKALYIRIADAAIQVVGTVLFVLLCVLLRRFIRGRFGFTAADRVIDLLIISNLVIAVLSLVMLAFPELETAVTQVMLIAIVTMGLLEARLGYMLLALPDDLGGLRKPYAYLIMLCGVFLASIILAPIAILLGAVADVMLGTIFFQASRSISTTV